VPAWAKDAVQGARAIVSAGRGNAALVTFNGSQVVKVQKLPDSLEAIMEAAK
jgi:hypothetical protein